MYTLDQYMMTVDATRLQFGKILGDDEEIDEGQTNLDYELIDTNTIKKGDKGWGKYITDNLFYRCVITNVIGKCKKQLPEKRKVEGTLFY